MKKSMVGSGAGVTPSSQRFPKDVYREPRRSNDDLSRKVAPAAEGGQGLIQRVNELQQKLLRELS